MQLIKIGLFLTLAVFLNSIEVSSQTRQPPASTKKSRRGRQGRLRMRLPYPYYYATSAGPNSEIRSHEHPNAHEVRSEDGSTFLGMAESDGHTFHPIRLPNGGVIALNLLERRVIYLTPEEAAILTAEIHDGGERSGSGSG